MNVKGGIYDFIEAYLNYKNKHLKIFENEYENHFNDYRDFILEEKEKYINEKVGQIPVYQLKRQI